MKSRVTPRIIGEHVHKRAISKLEKGEADRYWAAFRQTLDEDSELKHLYLGLKPATVKGPPIPPTPSASSGAGAELHNLTLRFMHQMNLDDYNWALRQIMKANPQLTKKYSQV